MDQNPSNSRVGVHFGKPIEGNEKAYAKASINFGKAAADLQHEKVKAIIGAEDQNLSLVVVLTPVAGKQVELEELIKSALEGVILQIKPGESLTEMASQMLGMVLGFGVEEIAASEQASINLNLLSGIDFFDTFALHDQDFSTLSAFLTSFLGELTLKTNPGSQLGKKLLGILKQFAPMLSGTPMPLLELMSTVDVDLTFKSTDDLPHEIRSKLGIQRGLKHGLKYFPRLPDKVTSSPEGKLIEKFNNTLTSHIEAYATVENVAAIHLDLNLAGFGTALLTTKEDDY
eukprot:CAMPEP_0176465944 /NCGR_PEP_ID=MMETSP0127-20121128/37589_1 /TAXON_ID=938130 /ORGANISM="Platyophrya macrostoma, Strain WH" /LENGTH=286 /DNA_ID=CAMNT_0017858999 /DNA_START=28 /DNA_END=888 /DNA_ORIENTATION=+